MFPLLEKIIKFINYWWFRYLMVTELYIVEEWERVVIHVILLIVFLIFWYFNANVMIPVVERLFNATSSVAAVRNSADN